MQNEKTSEDFLKPIRSSKQARIDPEAFLKFFKDGNTTEDILKSEAEIKQLAAEIYEKKEDANKISQTQLKAREALKFISQLKGHINYIILIKIIILYIIII